MKDYRDTHFVSELLTCSPSHISYLVKRGMFPEPREKVGNKRLWHFEDINHWITNEIKKMELMKEVNNHAST